MARPIRTGLIGCGKIAAAHASAPTALPESQFVAVCDTDAERARAVAAEYGAPRVIADPGEILGGGDVGAVSVCTPHPSHAAVVVAARKPASTSSARSRSPPAWPTPTA